MVILSEEASSSSNIDDHRYDVFLSFRGSDTRYGFTDHLHSALENANLTTFLDDEEIQTGEQLKPELESAIKASRASIIVLSNNYASSRWCLDELVLILEQHRNSKQIVIPVFYHVEPTDIRKQQKSFGDAMARHKQRIETETDVEKKSQLAEKMELWKNALTEVSNLKGIDVHGRLETKLINEIVKDIYHRLRQPIRSTLPLLIGMESSIKFVTSWLKEESKHTTHILTILGMAGIGKTSLANYVYGLHCLEFNRSSFIPDISSRCANLNGLLDVQKQLFHDISKPSSIQVYDVSEYNSMIDNALAQKKVLLVLDDIDSLDQLNALLGNKGFHPGSKIIITTKDASLTERCALFKTLMKPKHKKHEINGLYEDASLKLLCLHAFRCNNPKEGYEEVSKKLVKYCDGHPLALEILGSSLYGRDIAYWEECIKGLNTELLINFGINKVLRMSFDSLPSQNDKDLFKLIACFFVGIDRDISEAILKAFNINTKPGIKNLVDRCLIRIGRNNELMMQSLIQQMGRDLFHKESPDKPWTRALTQVQLKWKDAKGRKDAEFNEEITGGLRESSSISSTHNHIYDVFLSFRGADSRNSFTDHLYKALVEAGINTFLDDTKIQSGEHLKPEVESACKSSNVLSKNYIHKAPVEGRVNLKLGLESVIKSSRASIIVLSKNYASSTKCLEELVLILEQHRNFNQIVIPIFYHVEPTDVRKQFGDAMAKHKQRMEKETNAEDKDQLAHKIDTWRKALTEVAALKGKDVVNNRLETDIMEEIISDIQHQLGLPLRSTLSDLIGVDYHIRFICSWLKCGSTHNAEILTIHGMGGIGKTSLAKYVYGLHCLEFNRSSFIEDVSRRCANPNGLLDVQKQLCHDITKKTSIQVHDVSLYTSMIENALAQKKMLLVLDDIDSLDQLNMLLGNKGFHPESKIIITTKDVLLTERCALFNLRVHPKHIKLELQGLSETSSLQLLGMHTFKCTGLTSGYKQLSKELVKFCKGHPLAVKVLARSLYDRDVAEWEKCVEKLKKETDSPIEKILRMSFDSLPSQNDKELFKHVACFFVGMDKDYSETILKACGMRTELGISNLLDRCLLIIGSRNELMMHQLLQDMARNLVLQEAPENPWNQSRLWCHKDSFDVLKQLKGTENLKGLILDMRMLKKQKLRGSLELKTDALRKMKKLMLLQLNYVQINGSYKKFPENIRWLCMHGFPLKSIPLGLPMTKLVALDLSYSDIESFGMSDSYPQPPAKRQKLTESHSKDKRLLGSLKILNLSNCYRLRILRGFCEYSSIEKLFLTGCMSLIKVGGSIGQCDKLVLVDLSHCDKFKKLAKTIDRLKNVKTLSLDGCNLGEYSFTAIPRDLKSLAIYLPRSLVSLSLVYNNLSNESFPMEFSRLSMLKKLRIDGNPIVSMPICVRTLPRLEDLSMHDCQMLMSIDQPPPTLTMLSFGSCNTYYEPLLQKILFDPRMSPLNLRVNFDELPHSSTEIEGIVKIQPIAGVEETLLHSLGWSNLEFIRKRCVGRTRGMSNPACGILQMYYEFGIFSTFYGGEEMPNWFEDRSEGASISFTIPSSPTMLKGLNVCYVQTLPFSYETFGLPLNELTYLPLIMISNITKNRIWIYRHYLNNVYVGGKCLTFLSHWMFGKDEMEVGDQVNVTVKHDFEWCLILTCGVSFVYDAEDTEKEDALGYYKSWNHIIGGDLTAFQLTTGEYTLDKHRFSTSYLISNPFIKDGAKYEEDEVYFKALSQGT